MHICLCVHTHLKVCYVTGKAMVPIRMTDQHNSDTKHNKSLFDWLVKVA